MITNKLRPFYASKSLLHAQALMQRESITPQDSGCQDYLITHLERLGFVCKQYFVHGVRNLVACWGSGAHHVGFCGHTDVVPAGAMELWQSDPFQPVIRGDKLYGRGAADMKTGLAAMLAACEKMLPSISSQNTTFWWLITSDEEGEAEYGCKWIQSHLQNNNIVLQSLLVGEPSASSATGDTIKVGRRGSLSGAIDVLGKQGHVAYPRSSINAIHLAAKFINALEAYHWDTGSEDFPGTSFQTTALDSGKFIDNMVPGQCRVHFNIRYSQAFTEQNLKQLIVDIAATTIGKTQQRLDIVWDRPCNAYLSQPRKQDCLIRHVENAIKNTVGYYPLLSTSGGTSDGRFFASRDTQVVEVGVPNSAIHQVNEHIHLSDLATLEDIYSAMLPAWLA